MLRRLADHALAVHGRQLREHPAAKHIHHAYRGGLLEHVVSMAELALAVCGHYRRVDRDLVLLGVLFHDLGKIRELGAMPANDYTLEGRLIGHVVIGRDLLRECCLALGDVPDDLQLHLEHLVLSHQGKREFAAPVEPMTPEALVLHFLDDLDSKLNQFERVREEGGGLQWVRGLGRYVYLAAEDEAPGPPAPQAASDAAPAGAAPAAAGAPTMATVHEVERVPRGVAGPPPAGGDDGDDEDDAAAPTLFD